MRALPDGRQVIRHAVGQPGQLPPPPVDRHQVDPVAIEVVLRRDGRVPTDLRTGEVLEGPYPVEAADQDLEEQSLELGGRPAEALDQHRRKRLWARHQSVEQFSPLGLRHARGEPVEQSRHLREQLPARLLQEWLVEELVTHLARQVGDRVVAVLR